MNENNKNIHTASGAYKRKLKKIKNEASLKLLKTNSKIEQFFKNTSGQNNQNENHVITDIQVASTSALVEMEEHTNDSIDLTTVSSSISTEPQPALNVVDPSSWGNLSNESTDFIIRNLPKHLLAIKDCDFSKSKRQYPDKVRTVKEHMFLSRLPNGEIKKREWLMYSNTTGCLYCVPCKLFHSRNDSSFCKGFNDWKNSNRLKEHEQSAEHRLHTKSFVLRGNVLGKIDSALHENYLKEVEYWHRVLKRVVDVVKFLGTRGLAFRGSKEIFGCIGNGNFMGALELVAEYDDFLKAHIKTKGNPGSGNISYLSKTICNEFIELMYNKIVSVIVDELKHSKYYSISVDSTPDITHSDQLTVILRYVLSDGTPVERFIAFIKLNNHTGALMADLVINTLSELDIPICDMRGQSYDNASNMSGKYKGLQALIKEHNNLAEYVPCSAHSLNLVGTHAADCCLAVTKLFMFIQEFYVFISASTSRWAVLENIVKNSNSKNKLLPKRVNVTRWAAKWYAVKALLLNYWSFYDAVKKISDDTGETNICRAEANGISKQFCKLENAILINMWYDILQRFDQSSNTMQSTVTDLNVICNIYKSLKKYVLSLRDNFDSYEKRGKELSKTETYIIDNIDIKRRPKRKALCDEKEDELHFNGKEDFKINTFNVVIDRLYSELNERSNVYFKLNEEFGFLCNLSSISNEEIREKASFFATKYHNDIDGNFGEECIQFKAFVEGMFEEETDNNNPSRNSLLECLKLIRQQKLTTLFPNMDTALRIVLCMMTSNASGERSFSVLKRIKTYLRNSTSDVDSRLSSLASFVSNCELFQSLEFSDLIKDFAAKKSRKVSL